MDTDRLLRDLTDFLRIPSVSTNPSHNADCRAAAEWVAGELRRLGCREVQFLASGTHPVVWGVGPEVPGAPTLLIYGHYDVQPPEPLDEWTTPPFEPTVRDGKLFARGAADDKGQVFCLLKAIEERGGRPPVNFRFLIEGEEEYGSRVLFELLRREPERTRADAVLIADMAYIAPRWPAVYTTLRGLCYAEITVRTAKSDLQDRKSTRLNSSHLVISYAVFCLKKKKKVRDGGPLSSGNQHKSTMLRRLTLETA